MTSILIATALLDAANHLHRHDLEQPVVVVTPRSLHAARGCSGQVYATDAARVHPRFEDLIAATWPCMATLPAPAIR